MDDPIIVFDTDCVLCSRIVALILRHERKPSFRFVGAWSPTGLAMASERGYTRSDLDRTFLVLDGDRTLTHSDAGIAVLAELNPPLRWLAIARFMPRSIRDALYRLVARNRYRWFGRSTNCVVIPPDMRSRFIGFDQSE